MGWPTVSVIITSLNRAEHLQRTLLSVLRQDYPAPVQVIVADGGSTDGTVQMLRHYPQVTWWSDRDGGLVDTINRGLKAATGEFVAIQDSADFYLRDAFRLTLDVARNRPDIDIFTGCDIVLEPDGRSFVCSPLDDHDITPHSLLMHRLIPIHCAFIRRSVVDGVGGFRLLSELHTGRGGNAGILGIDIDFWYRALHFHRAQFVPHHTAVCQKPADPMSSHCGRWLANMMQMLERCEADPRYASRFRLTADEKRKLYIRWEIQQAHQTGRHERVRKLVKLARRDGSFNEQARQYLVWHGLLPRPADSTSRSRRPDHRVPDLHWYMQLAQQSLAA